MEPLQHAFGPVPSRRLGNSLGLSPIPPKTCNYSCTYCQLGRTNHMTGSRQAFYPVEESSENSNCILRMRINLTSLPLSGRENLPFTLGWGN